MILEALAQHLTEQGYPSVPHSRSSIKLNRIDIAVGDTVLTLICQNNLDIEIIAYDRYEGVIVHQDNLANPSSIERIINHIKTWKEELK
jgi:hypothetical protein